MQMIFSLIKMLWLRGLQEPNTIFSLGALKAQYLVIGLHTVLAVNHNYCR